MDPAVTILPRKRSALPQLGREEAPCRGARHDESFGRPSDICLRDRVGHGDRAGGSEAANLIEASREGAWGCAAELLPHIILSASRRIVAMPRAFHLEGCPWCASPY